MPGAAGRRVAVNVAARAWSTLLSERNALEVAGSTPLARETAAPTSSTPQPRSDVQTPPEDALSLRMFATLVASSRGFAAQTSAAAPATSGEANDVPLA